MTRINCYVSVKVLSNEHLLAEHREIKRVCNRYSQRKLKGIENDVPSQFTLGKGHELFFSNKPTYTLYRYKSIHQECLYRGFNVQDFSSNWDVYDDNCVLSYNQQKEDDKTIINRIIDNVKKSTKNSYGYYGDKLTREEYINHLNNYLINI